MIYANRSSLLGIPVTIRLIQTQCGTEAAFRQAKAHWLPTRETKPSSELRKLERNKTTLVSYSAQSLQYLCLAKAEEDESVSSLGYLVYTSQAVFIHGICVLESCASSGLKIVIDC